MAYLETDQDNFFFFFANYSEETNMDLKLEPKATRAKGFKGILRMFRPSKLLSIRP